MTERLIELGLRNRRENQLQTDSTSSSVLASFNARLLELISDIPIESDSLDTEQFRLKLEDYRRRLEESSDADPDLPAVANDCLQLIENYLDRARTYLLERESEFAQVINVMRLALKKLAGEAHTFNVRLMGSSERFNRLTEIEDIRELKKRIYQEVQDLNRVVKEKQKQDELQYAKLAQRIEVLENNLTHSKLQATIDPLTSVANRGHFDQTLDRWTEAHKENRTRFVLAIFDIDNFKSINDTYGHQVGDRVLVCVAQWLAKYIRANDVLARYGGEEFAVMVEDLPLSEAETRFTQLLASMSNCNYAFSQDGVERTVTFSASCGLAEFDLGESGEDLLRRADEALYVAKKTGKNRVVLAKTEKSLWKSLPWRGLPRSDKSKS